MKPDTPLDFAVFQLSPKRSRCELFVSSEGNSEKLASGSVKPFVGHLKAADEQFAQAVQFIRLEVEKRKHAQNWFTKGTLERFVRFVSTPEILELVNRFDEEMSQLEAARKIYSQGTGDQQSGALEGTGVASAGDATKKELLRAIDVRLVAVRQDLNTAYARASAAGFNPESVSELQQFADHFGANQLNESCTNFLSLCQRRPDMIGSWKKSLDDQLVRGSWESDMSIDDPTEDQWIHQQNQSRHHPANQQHVDTTQTHKQQSKPKPAFPSIPTEQQDSQNEKNEVEKKEEGVNESSRSLARPPVRQLSVQDRINLFENKQKEVSTSGGKSAVVGKSPELRRLSSDASTATTAVEKAVLRRWSGASDMSIDVSSEKKDSYADSPLCTPSSASHARSSFVSGVSEEKDQLDQNKSNNTGFSLKSEPHNDSGKDGDLRLEQQEVQNQVGNFAGKEEESHMNEQINLKDHLGSEAVQFRSFGKTEPDVVDYHGPFQEKSKGSLGAVERNVGVVDVSQNKIGGFVERAGNVKVDGESRNRINGTQLIEPPVTQSRIRPPQNHSPSFSGQFEGGIGNKIRDTQYKGTEVDQLTSLPRWKSVTGGNEGVWDKELASYETQPIFEEGSGTQRMKYQRPKSAGPEQNKISQARRDEADNKVLQRQEDLAMPVEQVQRARQTKGNQELNDELKLKANELEKLFADHKLRVPGDIPSSARRGKLPEAQTEQIATSKHKKPVAVDVSPSQYPEKNTTIQSSGNLSNFITPTKNIFDNHDTGHTSRQNLSEISFSDDSKGKLYERYMQKRDAKLKEEWSSNRLEKEAKLKSMQDIFERSTAEMKAKFAGSDSRDSPSNARRRVEKIMSFGSRSSMKKDQHPIATFKSEEDEDLSEFSEQKYYGQDRSFNESPFRDGASRSTLTKKVQTTRNISSAIPRVTAVPVPRSSAKVSNASSGRRRVQSEKLLAQSVPNFSDFRKENTKPSAAGKTTLRSQARSSSRSKNTNEEIPPVTEEKSRRPQPLKRNSSVPIDFTSSLNSDEVSVATLNLDKEHSEKKGNGTDPGARSSISKLKASEAPENLYNKEEEDEFFEAEGSVDTAKEDEHEELETIAVEDDNEDMYDGKPRLSQEADKSGNSGSENGDFTRSLEQIDPTSVAKFPAAIPLRGQTVASLLESPGESPVSWNSRLQHLFAYPHETSDIDASMDSPGGSPASWNSHSLTQTEVDAARMRKKWGTAKPVIVSNSSQNQSKKDMTKGLKRFLKFGRKNRGGDGLMDWISATTSEGDDDTEDGRDLATRSSEDLRKSRMGFLQGDDGFNESELYNEHVRASNSSIPAPPLNFRLKEDHISGTSIKAPRSFFSLSTFRSKGSESKPR